MKTENDKKYYCIYNLTLYIIHRSIEIGSPVSNLHIQKLLYYIQANFLVNNDAACFKEDILNWRYGPTVEEVYSELREFSSDPIDKVPTLEVFSMNKFEYEKINLNIDEFKEDKHLIDEVVDSYMGMRVYQLVQKTNNEKPCQETKKNEVISKRMIKKYYKENKNLILK